MIEDFEKCAPAWVKFEHVIKGECGIGYDQGRSIDAEACQTPAAPIIGSTNNEKYESGEAQKQTQG
jgi:hypothetical protein